MAKKYSEKLLRELRNDIPIAWLIADVLEIPSKLSEGYFRFQCPRCREFNTATNPRTNLARCFRCEANFNPIDLAMIVRRENFTDSVEFLLRHAPLSIEKPQEEK